MTRLPPRPVIALVTALVAVAGCARPAPNATNAPAAPPRTSESLPAADALFHQDPRWLGADAALSIPLAADRTLWLFGDTFVATSAARVRNESTMVRNSVAVQRGLDPLDATMEFAWGAEKNGVPTSFFAEDGERWYWPGHGARLDDVPGRPLVVFLFVLVGTPGVGLGFAPDGAALAVIDQPDRPLAEWRPRIVPIPRCAFDALPATAVVRDGPFVVGLAIRQAGVHAGTLVRHRADALARGDVSGAQWWAGDARDWIEESALGVGGPAFVIDDAGAECSLHRDARGRFVHVASYGFGASTIGLRTAPALTGPWTAPVTVFRPPESDAPRPFVYAAKAHPELDAGAPGALLVTYASNAFEFGDLFTESGRRDLYWPRFVRIHAGD